MRSQYNKNKQRNASTPIQLVVSNDGKKPIERVSTAQAASLENGEATPCQKPTRNEGEVVELGNMANRNQTKCERTPVTSKTEKKAMKGTPRQSESKTNEEATAHPSRHITTKGIMPAFGVLKTK